jgi:hypothetical protein
LKQNLFSGRKSKPTPDLSREEFAREMEEIGKHERPGLLFLSMGYISGNYHVAIPPR